MVFGGATASQRRLKLAVNIGELDVVGLAFFLTMKDIGDRDSPTTSVFGDAGQQGSR
jgi:hypothetical protein